MSWMRNWSTDAIETPGVHWFLVPFSYMMFLEYWSVILSAPPQIRSPNPKSLTEKIRDVQFTQKSPRPWLLQVGLFNRHRDRAWFFRTEKQTASTLGSSFSFLHLQNLLMLNLLTCANSDVGSSRVLLLWLHSLIHIEKVCVILQWKIKSHCLW